MVPNNFVFIPFLGKKVIYNFDNVFIIYNSFYRKIFGSFFRSERLIIKIISSLIIMLIINAIIYEYNSRLNKIIK